MASVQPLLVSPGGNNLKKKKRPPMFPVVRLAISSFAILSACLFILTAATIIYGDSCSSCTTAPTTSQQSQPAACSSPAATSMEPASSSSPAASVEPASSSKCYRLPGARPVLRGIMWRSPPQAVLALALLLAGGRRTRPGTALAFATLAVTAANHVLYARLARIVCVATAADAIGTVSAVVFSFYLSAATLLILVGLLSLLLMEGENAE